MSERIQMPVETPADAANTRSMPAFSSPFNSAQDFEPASPSLPLSHYLWILRRHLRKMLGFVAASVLLTFVISARLKPTYESSATINIDLQAPSDVVGQGAANPMTTVDSDIFFTTQMRLIQSDAVLRPVAEQFQLIGGGDPQSIADVQKTQALVSAPIFLGHLYVTRPISTYLLQISYRASNPQLAANIANAVANSYLAQIYNLRTRSSAELSSFMGQQLDELKAKMERSSLALAKFEKDMDVINPEQKTDILSARLQQLNSVYTVAQTDRVSKEAAWNAMKSGSVAAAEISSQGTSLKEVGDALNQAQAHFALVKSTFGVNHPEYRKAATQLAEARQQFDDARRSIIDKVGLEYQESADREQMLKQALDEAKAQWDEINAGSFEYEQLKQGADADRALYNELITKINEAGINAEFQSNNIRLADMARPPADPVSPNIKLNVLLALLLSALLAVGAALLLDALDTTLRDPNEASRYLGADVIGTLPLDRDVPELAIPSALEDAASEVLASGLSDNGNRKSREDGYRSISALEEAVRTVRNTILLSDFEQRLRSIAITSAEPREGKTTLASHLAIANAARGKTTLLVDGDLRRPSIHARFGLKPHVGLSNVLNGEITWESAVVPIEGRPNLSVLASGPGSHRAADMIGPHLAELLDEFAKRYDLVILDSPPLLGFAECLQMANAADGVLIVSKAGHTKRKAVASTVSALRRIRANLIGVVLNQIKPDTSADGYSYHGYHSYKHQEEQE